MQGMNMPIACTHSFVKHEKTRILFRAPPASRPILATHTPAQNGAALAKHIKHNFHCRIIRFPPGRNPAVTRDEFQPSEHSPKIVVTVFFHPSLSPLTHTEPRVGIPQIRHLFR